MLDKTSEDASWTPAMEGAIRSFLDPSLTSGEINAAMTVFMNLFRKSSTSRVRHVLVDTEARRTAFVEGVLRVLGPWAELYPATLLHSAILDTQLALPPYEEWTFDVFWLAALNPSVDSGFFLDESGAMSTDLFSMNINTYPFRALFALHNPLASSVMVESFDLFLNKVLDIDELFFGRFLRRLVLPEYILPSGNKSPPNPMFQPAIADAMRKRPQAFREAIAKTTEGVEVPSLHVVVNNWGAFRKRQLFRDLTPTTRSMGDLIVDIEGQIRKDDLGAASSNIPLALGDLAEAAKASLGTAESALLATRVMAAFLKRLKAPPYLAVLDRIL